MWHFVGGPTESVAWPFIPWTNAIESLLLAIFSRHDSTSLHPFFHIRLNIIILAGNRDSVNQSGGFKCIIRRLEFNNQITYISQTAIHTNGHDTYWELHSKKISLFLTQAVCAKTEMLFSVCCHVVKNHLKFVYTLLTDLFLGVFMW